MKDNNEQTIRKQILGYLRKHPGARKRYIANYLNIWQCDFLFLSTMDDLYEDGLIRYETVINPAQLEYYDKWFVVDK